MVLKSCFKWVVSSLIAITVLAVPVKGYSVNDANEKIKEASIRSYRLGMTLESVKEVGEDFAEGHKLFNCSSTSDLLSFPKNFDIRNNFITVDSRVKDKLLDVKESGVGNFLKNKSGSSSYVKRGLNEHVSIHFMPGKDACVAYQISATYRKEGSRYDRPYIFRILHEKDIKILKAIVNKSYKKIANEYGKPDQSVFKSYQSNNLKKVLAKAIVDAQKQRVDLFAWSSDSEVEHTLTMFIEKTYPSSVSLAIELKDNQLAQAAQEFGSRVASIYVIPNVKYIVSREYDEELSILMHTEAGKFAGGLVTWYLNLSKDGVIPTKSVQKINELLDMGADPNYRYRRASEKTGHTGGIVQTNTAFFLITNSGLRDGDKVKLARRFLNLGADPNEYLEVLSGLTDESIKIVPLLYLCAKRGDWECLKLLVEYGADLNIKYSNTDIINAHDVRVLGETPLYPPVKRNKIEIVKFLLQNGANPNIVRKDGKTLKSITIESGQTNMYLLLKKFGDI